MQVDLSCLIPLWLLEYVYGKLFVIKIILDYWIQNVRELSIVDKRKKVKFEIRKFKYLKTKNYPFLISDRRILETILGVKYVNYDVLSNSDIMMNIIYIYIYIYIYI